MMSKPRRSRKAPRVTEDVRIARSLLPAAQAKANTFMAVDIANHSDGDQRKMVRSGERRTIRRKPKIDELVTRGVLSRAEAAACQWYADAHALRYDTTGVTARWGEGGGCRQTSFDHLPKTRAQQEALDHFDYAREGISPSLLALFESVVLHGRPLNRRILGFAVAVEQLLKRIAGRVNI